MEIKRRFQKFCQKYQKLHFTKKKMQFFKDHTSGTSDAPTVHLGHLSQTSRCPRPPRDTCPLPFWRCSQGNKDSKHNHSRISINVFSYYKHDIDEHV